MKTSPKSIKPLASGFGLLLGLLTALPAAAEIVERIVGQVNDRIITLTEVEERAVGLQARWQDASNIPNEKAFQQEALEMLIEENLLISEGKKRDIAVKEAQVDKAVKGIQTNNRISDEALKMMLEREGLTFEKYKEQIRNQILITQVRKALFENRVRIGGKKLLHYYKTHRKEFTTPTKIHARHIMYIFGKHLPETAKQTKREKARKVLKEIQAGANFNEMAKFHSEDISASKGGDLGILEEGKMVKSFQDAAFKLSAHEVSPIVETPYGLHIIKVDKKIPGKILSFKEARDQIQRIVIGQGMQEKYKEWIAELKKSSYIETTLFKKPPKKSRKTRRGIRQTASLPKAKNRLKEKKLFKTKKSHPKKTRLLKQPSNQKPAGKKAHSKKTKSSPSSPSDHLRLSTMEKKLIHIKELKNQNKISESEYQKRKRQLLNQL